MRILLYFLFLFISFTATGQQYYLFIGTYTHTGSKGIYVYRFDAATSKLTWVSNTEGIVNPSYLTIAPNGKYIYSCTESRMPNAGSISAFAFDNKTGKLSFINKQSSGGENPVYVSVHKSNKWVVNANYTGGSLAVMPINKDGSLQPAQQTIQHSGSSVNKERQSAPHVHSSVFSLAQDYVFTPDLGMDKIMIYRFDAAKEKPLTPAQQPFVVATPGSGPRHFTFHPNGKWAYLVEEISGTVVVYCYEPKKGALDSFQRIAAHPEEATGPFSGADIHVSPDGKFLYASNRAKENNIAIFSINAATGKLKLAGYQSTLGEVPRNFIIEPSGKFLLVANQETGNVVVFKRDPKTGLLQPTGEQINVPQPVSLQLLKF